MKRLAWLTDLHLKFVIAGHGERLCRSVAETGADAVLFTGDIGEAHDEEPLLKALDVGLGMPPYFVLGIHDFHGGGIARVRAGIQGLCARSPRLTYLTRAGFVALTEETGPIGHDSRVGDYAGSGVLLDDYRLIEGLAGLDKEARLGRLPALGDEAAAHFRSLLPVALVRFRCARPSLVDLVS